MNKALDRLNFPEETFRTIWRDKNITAETKTMRVLIPLVLTFLLICSHQLFFKHITTVPYILLFCIILVSASYGVGRGALSATLITFFGAVVDYSFSSETGIFTLLLYLIAGLFLSAQLHFFMHHQRKQDNTLIETNETTKELIRMEKNQEDFVNMASHELKLPVTILKAYAQMVYLKKDKPGFDENYLSITEKMDVQLDKLLNIIADLQDATRVNSDSLTCLMNEFNLNESLRNTVDEMLVSHPDVVIEYELAYPDPLIKGDRDRIEQVVNNLIGNGLKYSGAEKFIKITSVIEEDGIKVTIADHGYGIAPEKQSYIFDRFFRAGSAQLKKLPGLGLGLFICKEIIKQHQGTIGVKSEVGRGSEFWFCLPR
ncbi:cell wall metabolism sensor histidine kinase WalK [Pedobacter sp. L105]|uniref:sensor histidine kinase n=1 Tax=Pedobacter sp. L105 TaxID=1641871 RepID=UPI00131C8988|nr:HAMP domain-containing sensor histidine kinase [Pedobacter sp. L105]